MGGMQNPVAADADEEDVLRFLQLEEAKLQVWMDATQQAHEEVAVP
jgi:hypothetical protein